MPGHNNDLQIGMADWPCRLACFAMAAYVQVGLVAMPVMRSGLCRTALASPSLFGWTFGNSLRAGAGRKPRNCSNQAKRIAASAAAEVPCSYCAAGKREDKPANYGKPKAKPKGVSDIDPAAPLRVVSLGLPCS